MTAMLSGALVMDRRCHYVPVLARIGRFGTIMGQRGRGRRGAILAASWRLVEG